MSSRTGIPAELLSAFSSDMEAEGFKLENASFGSGNFTGCILRSSAIRSSDMSAVSFRGGAFTDVVFDGVDLSGADFSECLLSNVSFISSKLTGIHLSGCRIRRVRMENCICRYSSFDESSMMDSLFISSDFTSSSFSGMKVLASAIEKSVLSSVSFIRTSLIGLSLADSSIDGIALSEDLSEIHGAKLDINQAVALIRGKGADIRA